MPRKLALVVVDSLRTDMLLRAVGRGMAPTLGQLLERGELIEECVSAFPSVTPVCCSEIVTGERGDRHWISGMNWYHRLERRYVEYGSSFEATRTFGLFRTLQDIVYNMNMGHLSPEVATIFERLGDAGLRSACTPFLIYRGRTRHELGLEGALRTVAMAARFRHATWGPDELFYGELYSSRRVPCRPTLARPGTRDEYSACAARELVEEDLYDFLLFSLPDNDYHSHRFGPEATLDSIAHADRCLGELVEAGGGVDSFLAEHAVIVMADHAQTAVQRELPLGSALGAEWRVLEPSTDRPERAEVAVSPSARAAGLYVLGEGRQGAWAHWRMRERLAGLEGVDLVTWLAQGERPLERAGPGVAAGQGMPQRIEAVVETRRGELRFRPGGHSSDRRGRRWALDGDLAALGLERRDGQLVSDAYPDALGRLWSALCAPHAGDILVSLEPGWECVDWGGTSHLGGGSHGSLHAGDSLGPLLLVGLEAGTAERREQWALADVASLVLEHYGIAESSPVAAGAAAL